MNEQIFASYQSCGMCMCIVLYCVCVLWMIFLSFAIISMVIFSYLLYSRTSCTFLSFLSGTWYRFASLYILLDRYIVADRSFQIDLFLVQMDQVIGVRQARRHEHGASMRRMSTLPGVGGVERRA